MCFSTDLADNALQPIILFTGSAGTEPLEGDGHISSTAQDERPFSLGGK
jgi:hypothetical protein